MKIELHRIPVRDLVNGYVDDPESGVCAYGGRLDVRPAYQREFVYKEKERDAVISTVMKGFPLNVMYWVKKDDGTFEVMDGQQRTISLCQYFNGDFSWGEVGAVGGLGAKFFHRQPEDVKARFLDYELMVYFCEGTASEKIDWFRVINIAGLKLTAQEMRNAVYSGPWVTDAKRYFSKPGCVASKIGAKYLNGSSDRQEYLETAIEWIVNSAKDKVIEDYMAIHQGDDEATELWLHFQKVVNWIDTIFPKYRKEMEGDHIVPWSKGGKTVPENLQLHCRRCNAIKSDN